MKHPVAEAIFEEFGIEIVPANVVPGPKQTRAVATLQRIIRRYGEEHGRFVVLTIAETGNNDCHIDETSLWSVSDIILAFRKNHPDMMASEPSRFLEFFDRVPVGMLQFWLLGLDGICNKRAALTGLIWERACRVFGERQMDLLDDRRLSEGG